MSEDKKYTVGDLKAMLRDLPDDMPLFYIDHYHDICEPVTEGLMPSVDRVVELQFENHRCFELLDNKSRAGYVSHTVLREFDTLAF
jgi:hypothetical protein